ncbi:hypothetical protein [Paraburkholderia xenovorans]|nr:hypothetical protein [Paraburkholderia xenovorans]
MNRHAPFPSSMRGDKDGAYCEVMIDGGDASRFLIIRPIEYMRERDRDLIGRGIFEIKDLYPEVERLGHIPCEEVVWLYKLEVFVVEKIFHGNSELFFENTMNFDYFVFDDYGCLLRFCEEKYGVKESDFSKSWETGYPQS